MAKNQIQLEARGITKKNYQKILINNTSLQLREKECLGIVGDVDSGRRTLLQILSGLVSPDMGEMFVLERNAFLSRDFVRRTVAIASSADAFEEEYSPYTNVVAYGCGFGLSRSKSCERADLLFREFKIEEIKLLSLSSLKHIDLVKLILCRALSVEPKVLILNDLTKGLNSNEVHEIKSIVKKIQRNGVSIIYSTDNLTEIESLCDRVLIMDKGKVLISGKPDDIMKEHIGFEVIELKMRSIDLQYYTERIKNEYDYFSSGDELRLFLKNGQSHIDIVKNISGEKILIRKPNLHDVYLKLGCPKLERTIG